jgi:hypothetical protein
LTDGKSAHGLRLTAFAMDPRLQLTACACVG